MSTASVTAPALLTAEQFAERPDPGYPEELVKGRVVPMPVPSRVTVRFAAKRFACSLHTSVSAALVASSVTTPV